jgi:hypothetical protein
MSEKIFVSLVTAASDTATRHYDATKVINKICLSGAKGREQVQKIRETLRRDKAAADELKKKLPAVLWSGTFSQRANDKLITHSGLLCADLDSLNSELSAVREKLAKSPHLWALFTSPSGNGLKAVFRVPADPAKHAGSFRAIEQHVKELTGVQIDQACKDVARLCFLSCDPRLIHKPDAIEIEPLPEPEKPSRPTNNAPVDLSARQRIATELLGDVGWQSDTTGYCVCPGVEKHTTGNGRRDCRVTLDNAPVPTIHCLHNSCASVIETYNYRLRSLISKVEYTGRCLTSTSTEFSDSPSIAPNCVDVDAGSSQENTPAPVPYVSPPLTLLPGELQDYVHAAAESLNVDVSFVLLPVLSALGSALGNTRSILLKRNFIQPPIIWTGIIGRSGSRKSPSLDAGCFAIIEHERELARQNKLAMDLYEDDMAEWESKTKKERGVKPGSPVSLTCLMDNLTLEALADAIQSSARGVLVKKDELSHWFASFDQYTTAKGADVSQWLSLHTGVFFGLDRRSDHRRYRVHQPRVALAGGIQPGVLKRILTEDFFERGLPARFLFAYPPFMQDRWTEAQIPDALRASVLALFQKLWEIEPAHDDRGEACPKLLRLGADAKAEYVHYYNECGAASIEAGEREEAAWSKLSGYAARLALVGQCVHDHGVELVSGEIMRAACALARWFGNEALRIYASLGETKEQRETRKLVEFIESRGGAVTVREVMQSYWPLKNQREEAEAALNSLAKRGRGKWEQVPTTARGGQPTRKLRLLHSSTSTEPLLLRGKTGRPVDVDAPNSQKITPSGDSDAEEDRIIELAKSVFPNATVIASKTAKTHDALKA